MNDIGILLDRLMELEYEAKYGIKYGISVPTEHLGEEGYVFNSVLQQSSKKSIDELFNDSSLITSIDFINEVKRVNEEKFKRIAELTEFLSEFPSQTVFQNERKELAKLKEDVSFLDDITNRFSANVIEVINKNSRQCDLNDYDSLKIANFNTAREKIINMLDSLSALAKYDKVAKFVDLKRRLDNKMIAVPLINEKVAELNDLFVSIRNDGINIPNNLIYNKDELDNYIKAYLAKYDKVVKFLDLKRRLDEKKIAVPLINEKVAELNDLLVSIRNDGINIPNDLIDNKDEAEEAKKEQEELKENTPTPMPNPTPTPEPMKEEDGWRDKAEEDWLKASEEAAKRHREAEEAKKEQEEIQKELKREEQNSISIDPKDIKLNFGKFDGEYDNWKKNNNEFNMIPGSVDMANLFRNGNSVGALLSGIDSYDKSKIGKKVSENKIVKKVVVGISSIPDKIAEKIKSKQVNSKNHKIVDRMKNFRNKIRDKVSNGISIKENNKINAYYNELLDLKNENKLNEELDKNPGKYRDICDAILKSGSNAFTDEDIKMITDIEKQAKEIVDEKFSGRGSR